MGVNLLDKKGIFLLHPHSIPAIKKALLPQGRLFTAWEGHSIERFDFAAREGEME
jgi:hypothetical protein